MLLGSVPASLSRQRAIVSALIYHQLPPRGTTRTHSGPATSRSPGPTSPADNGRARLGPPTTRSCGLVQQPAIEQVFQAPTTRSRIHWWVRHVGLFQIDQNPSRRVRVSHSRMYRKRFVGIFDERFDPRKASISYFGCGYASSLPTSTSTGQPVRVPSALRSHRNPRMVL